MIAIFPEIVACAASGNGEKLAVLVRKYFGVDQTYAPKLDVMKLLRQAGLEVQVLPIASQAALLAKDENGSFRIVAVLSESVGEDRRNFMCAHMLGHVLFDIQPKIARGDLTAGGFRENQCPMARYAGDIAPGRMPEGQADLEARADHFAAAVLMPKSMVARAYQKIKDVEKTARFFGVSTSCMRKRLEMLGLTASAPINFIDAEEKIRATKPKKVLREDIDPASHLKVDEAKMPRSVAASTYDNNQKSARPKAVTSQPTAAETAEATPAEKSKGLARIRELARRIDKSV